MTPPATRTALVFGATGYTGRAVVRRWAERGPVVAHVRPGSQAKLDIAGSVRVVQWESAAITALVAETKPDVVFSLLGTTRSRAKHDLAPADAEHPYEAVDQRLSILAATAVSEAAPSALFVYLSALGVNGQTQNPYLKARFNVEQALTRLGLRHVVARPAFISGRDRAEFRLGERVAAVALDGVFNLGALSGLSSLRELKRKYASLTGDELAAALVALGRQQRTGEVLADELRRLGAEQHAK